MVDLNPFATAKKSHRERYRKSPTFIPVYQPPKPKKAIKSQDFDAEDTDLKSRQVNAFVKELLQKPIKDMVQVETFNVVLQNNLKQGQPSLGAPADFSDFFQMFMCLFFFVVKFV